MVSVRHVTKRYGDQLVVDDVTVDLADGIVALVGDSGAGKSTLLHLITGVKRPDGGTVRVGDVDVTALDDDGRRRFLAGSVVAVTAGIGDGPGAGVTPEVPLVVADDPTDWLGGQDSTVTAELLVSLRAPGRVVIVATHDPRLWAVADQTVELAAGRFLA